MPTGKQAYATSQILYFKESMGGGESMIQLPASNTSNTLASFPREGIIHLHSGILIYTPVQLNICICEDFSTPQF